MIQNIHQAISKLFEIIGSVEKELGLRPNFLRDLFKEDDWSFIIKAHALVEVSVSQGLADVLDDRLLPVFQRLDLSDSRIGQIVFAKSLSLLNDEQRKFIRKLSELRNSLVHDIKKLDLNLTSYIDSLDPNQRKSLLDSFVPIFSQETREQWIENPKTAIWISVIDILVHTTIASMITRLEKQIKQLSYEQIKLIGENSHPERK